MIAVLSKRCHKGSVIPKSAILFSTESLENLETMPSKLSQNRTRVVQLIRCRYQPGLRIRSLEMVDVRAFSFQPRWLWRFVGVGASINDFGDVIAEFLPDVVQSFRATAIFHGVMKQC